MRKFADRFHISEARFRREAKALVKRIALGDPFAIERFSAVWKPDPHLPEATLQRVQHVLAVEAGYRCWDELVKPKHTGELKPFQRLIQVESIDNGESYSFPRTPLTFVLGRSGSGKSATVQALAFNEFQSGRRVLWCSVAQSSEFEKMTNERLVSSMDWQNKFYEEFHRNMPGFSEAQFPKDFWDSQITPFVNSKRNPRGLLIIDEAWRFKKDYDLVMIRRILDATHHVDVVLISQKPSDFQDILEHLNGIHYSLVSFRSQKPDVNVQTKIMGFPVLPTDALTTRLSRISAFQGNGHTLQGLAEFNQHCPLTKTSTRYRSSLSPLGDLFFSTTSAMRRFIAREQVARGNENRLGILLAIERDLKI